MPPRQRLSPEARRAQLLGAAAHLFARHPYEEVMMEHVAEAAGVSRALLYRHFSSKAALFAAMYQQAADRLLVETRLETGLPLADQLAQGMDVHLDYFTANRNTVLAANRVLAGDPVIRTIISNELDVLRERLMTVLPLADESVRSTVSDVLKSWLVFVQVLCVDWLAHETCPRSRLRDICVGAALGALRPLLGEDLIPHGESASPEAAG
ncbi:TetR/AcrR family transcriptional regulator [Streptomyces sp. NPDC059740]|uniref:TetR/AcrR family transcriptional regulator n=1 Tax=Streptomyces sp. NPDC059740 TaxID=3346926 RepID=UPI003662168A